MSRGHILTNENLCRDHAEQRSPLPTAQQEQGSTAQHALEGPDGGGMGTILGSGDGRSMGKPLISSRFWDKE